MAKQIIPIKMWPVNSQGTPIVNTVTYPERSIKLVDGIYQARIQKPGTGQVIQVKLSTSILPNQFQIKLTRDDGTIIGWPQVDETESVEFIVLSLTSTVGGSKYPIVQVMAGSENEYWTQNSETGIWSYSPFDVGDEYYGTVVISFNPTTNYWSISPWPWSVFVEDEKFYINAQCQYDIPVQYPYRYKPADKLKIIDAVVSGKYDVQIPYFKTLTTSTPEITYEIIPNDDGTIHYLLSQLTLNKLVKISGSSSWSWLIENNTHKTTLTVWCSVPWVLTESIREPYISSTGFDEFSDCFNYSSGNCEVVTCEVGGQTSDNDIVVTGENISYSGNSLIPGGMTVSTEYEPVADLINGMDYEISMDLIEKVSLTYPKEVWCEDNGGTWYSIQLGENFRAYTFSDSGTGADLVSKKQISANPKLT